MNQQAPRKLFDCLADFDEPGHVYIVGAGETGRSEHGFDRIPDGAFTIATNSTLHACDPSYLKRKSLQIKPCIWSVWMCFDSNAPKDTYWPAPIPPETKVVIGRHLAEKHRRPDLTFEHGPAIRPGRSPVIEQGFLKGGGTVVGCAIQFGWFIGAAHFTLVSVDMRGNRHWNGSKTFRRGRGDWPQKRRLQYLIDTLRRKGAIFDSLTSTALNVPVVKAGR
jgi:hypothetical protein